LSEFFALRHFEAKKSKIQQNFANNTKLLDEIINSQRPCNEKSGLGCKSTFVKNSSSVTTEKEVEQKIYVDIVKDPIKKEESMIAKETVQDQKTRNQQPAIRKP